MATVYGNNNSNVLTWWSGVTNGNDLIYGFDGNDTIYGLGGEDTIKGGGGADAINGGSGIDTASYMDSTVGVTVNLSNGRGFGGTAEGDTLASIENLLGSQHNDTLTGDNGNNVLSGLNGDDILKGGGGADRLNGDAGNDTLKGGGGADVLNGGDGIDTASYTESEFGVTVSLITDVANGGDATGDDLNSIENVTGSAHADTLIGDNGANVLRGMNGNDTLKGYGGNDTLVGDDGNDNLFGMDGADTLRGDAGNDTLDGGVGADAMIGGLGNDTYRVDNAGDTVTELANQGIDTVNTSLGAFTMGANIENLTFDNVAGAGVRGYGNALNNTMTGNNASNLLDGGAGADTLTGGGGVDNFVFRAGQANGDRIIDFNGLGAATGDSLIFVGYGTIADGATFRQQSATTWEIASADGTIRDVITFVNGAPVEFGASADFAFVLA
jgi:Ca2+-binding RTX toxin-like protein